jgi:hypothetical protein
MAMQRSDAAKALRTKTADVAVVKRGSMMLSAKRPSAQRMRKSLFGNAWKLQILATVIGSPSASGQRLEKKQGPSASQKCVDFGAENQPG